ncbi:hypothetical protein V0U79_05220 [Hyphobacterium sp. HN65]|uniref:Lipoprotein n=1 Tax=Hyphobacterium lacteum TaxID=3116575 RepID=A0ABU7LQ85_9PROT|nr:hypothetical protein [Hyphobacterium sp. HN65]MEE2525759.1 hypothetical protein [Hyphobacterium sp. HN65]
MKKLFLMGVAGLLVTACATTSEDTQLATSAERPADEVIEAADGESVRCRNIRQTGSRLRTRVCRTQDEWDQMAADAQEIRRSGGQDGVPVSSDPVF